jgi:hypothetical protein
MSVIPGEVPAFISERAWFSERGVSTLAEPHAASARLVARRRVAGFIGTLA